jgi:Calx-beta domain
MMTRSCFRLAVPLSLLLLLPLTARPDEPPPSGWGPVQEYLYVGSRLLVISRPYGVTGPPFITNSQMKTVVSESAGWVKVFVELTTPSEEPTTAEVRVKYATTSGSAVAGSDFKQTSGVLVFPAESASGTRLEIEVPILDDTTSEPEKAFSVVLSDPTGAKILSRTSQTIVITDDDTPPADSGGQPL